MPDTSTPEGRRTPSHAARLVLMYFLRHHLRLLSNQEIADLFDLGHRSTALRSMRIIDEVEQLLPEYERQITTPFYQHE